MALSIRVVQSALPRALNLVVALSMAFFLLAPAASAYAANDYCRTWADYQKTSAYEEAIAGTGAATWNTEEREEV